MTQLSNKGQALLDMLLAIPPNIEEIKQELSYRTFSAEDISKAAIMYLEECFDEHINEAFESHKYMEALVIPNLHSTYVYEVVELLLQYGLDPNAVYDDTNIMYELKYVDNEYIGADTLALLFENGGRLDLVVDGEAIFDNIGFDVIFDSIEQYDRRRYDALVHCWLVYLGYGAAHGNRIPAVDVFKVYDSEELFDLKELKNHRNFTFGLSYVDGRGEKWSLHIFDRRTRWEVARL